VEERTLSRGRDNEDRAQDLEWGRLRTREKCGTAASAAVVGGDADKDLEARIERCVTCCRGQRGGGGDDVERRGAEVSEEEEEEEEVRKVAFGDGPNPGGRWRTAEWTRHRKSGWYAGAGSMVRACSAGRP
jgi:hypothetical protein